MKRGAHRPPWRCAARRSVPILQTCSCIPLKTYQCLSSVHRIWLADVLIINSELKQILTIVVSWMEPKLLMKMFTLSSTGIPEFRERKEAFCIYSQREWGVKYILLSVTMLGPLIHAALENKGPPPPSPEVAYSSQLPRVDATKQTNKHFCRELNVLCRAHKRSSHFLWAWAKQFTSLSPGCSLEDYDMDVNGGGTFSPTWNQEQMFGCWSGGRHSVKELVLLIIHKTSTASAAKGQRVETTWRLQKTISQTQRSSIARHVIFMAIPLRLKATTVWHLHCKHFKDGYLQDNTQ